MRAALLSLLVLSAGCAIDDDVFVTRLAEQDCAYALECFDEPILNFYGWSDQGSCEASHGPDLAALAASCSDYDAKAARTCLSELEDRSCQGEGPGLDRPDSCDAVFTSCEGADTGATDEVDTGSEDG